MGYSKHFTLILPRYKTKQDIPAYVLSLTVNSYFQISGQSYQQMGGGQFGKGPMALPETNLCKFVESDTVVYPSLRRVSNLPEKCPFKKVTMPLIKSLEALGNGIIKWCVRSPALLRNHNFKMKNKPCRNISKLIQNKNVQNQTETHLPETTINQNDNVS
jgi:hypothetical protein